MNANIIQFSLLFSSAMCLGLGIWLYFKKYRNRYIPSLIAITIWSSLWAFSVYLFLTIQANIETLYVVNGLLYVFAGLIAISFLEFSIFLSRKVQTLSMASRLLLYSPLGLTILGVATHTLTPEVILSKNTRFITIGFVFYIYTIFIMGYFLYGLYLLFRANAYAKGHEKKVLSYCIAATLCTGAIDVTFNLLLLPFINYRLLWAGPLSGFIWCGILTCAIAKYDIKIVITKFSATLISLTLVVLSALFFYSFVRTASFYSSLLVYLTMVIFWAIAYSLVFDFIYTPIEKKFLKGFYDIQKIITTLSTELLIAQKQIDVLKTISKKLQEELETKNNYFIFSSLEDDTFKLYHHNYDQPLFALENTHPLLHFFYSVSVPIAFDALPKDAQDSIGALGVSPKTLFFPIHSIDKFQGLFILGEKLSGKNYIENDIAMIKAVIAQLMIVFDRICYQTKLKQLNENLEKRVEVQAKEINEKRKIEEELTLAKNIQLRLLPSRPPLIAHYKFDTAFQAAKMMSGDYYDFIVFSENEIGIIIADIVGKGVPASLFMVNLKSIIHQRIRAIQTPAEVVRDLNTCIFENKFFDKYVPLIYAKLNVRDHTFTYVNAGHEYGLYFSNNTCMELSVGGPPLGMELNETYQEQTITLHDNDIILLYTDGLPDARNPKNEQFGIQRIQEITNRYLTTANKKISLLNSILQSWVLYTDEQNRHKDDMTLISIECEKLEINSR